MSISIKINNLKKIIINVVFFLYFFCSFFNEYLIAYGLSSRIFVFLLIISVMLCLKPNMSLNKIGFVCLPIYIWFIYKFLSIIWGGGDPEGILVIKAHLGTHILMLMLVYVIEHYNINIDMFNNILNMYYLSSIFMCLLELLFHGPFQGIDSRQVITLPGVSHTDDPNALAAIFAVALTLSLYRVIFKQKYVEVLVIVLSTFAILLTGSRAGIITMLGVLFFNIYFYMINSPCQLSRKIFVICVMLIVCILSYNIIINNLPSSVFERLFIKGYGDGSGRVTLWNETFECFKKYPVFGAGWGGKYIRTHNTFLSMLLDIGIVGLLFFIIFILGLYLRNRKNCIIANLILVAALIPSIFIEAITLRYLWNSFIISLIATKIYKKKEGDKY